jgi:hypothetical protein
MRFFGILTYIAAKLPHWFDFGPAIRLFGRDGRAELGPVRGGAIPASLSGSDISLEKNVSVFDIRRKT